MDFLNMKLCKVIVILASLTCFCEGKPVYPSPRWFDYDYFPEAKPVQDTESGHVVPLVNPLRPYEPWILDCILFSSDKVEPGKRSEKCQDVDGENEREYGKFLYYVTEWEKAYPERATRWNSRFPDAKEKEKKRYAQLKGYADMHKKNVSADDGTPESEVSTSTQRADCPASCKQDDNAKGHDDEEESVQEQRVEGDDTPVDTRR